MAKKDLSTQDRERLKNLLGRPQGCTAWEGYCALGGRRGTSPLTTIDVSNYFKEVGGNSGKKRGRSIVWKIKPNLQPTTPAEPRTHASMSAKY